MNPICAETAQPLHIYYQSGYNWLRLDLLKIYLQFSVSSVMKPRGTLTITFELSLETGKVTLEFELRISPLCYGHLGEAF